MSENSRTTPSTRKIAAGAVAGLIVMTIRALVEGEPPDWDVLEAYLTVVVFAFVLPSTMPKSKRKRVEELEAESDAAPRPTNDREA